MTVSHAGPSYGLNPHLSVDTPEPPVPMAKAWAAAYPSPSSPLATAPSSSSPSEPRQALQPLLNLAQGVPGHAPHESLLAQMDKERQKRPMETHGYGGVFGDEGLRSALAADLCRVYGDGVSSTQSNGASAPIVRPENIAITAGCNLAAAVVFHALAAPGEAVVLPTPWYFNHQMTLASLAIEAVPLPTQAPAFLPRADELEALLASRNGGQSGQGAVKAVVLITPNNPTGAIYPPRLLSQLAGICRKWNAACIVDETYRDFLLEERGQDDTSNGNGMSARSAKPHTLFTDPSNDWQNSIISLHSFSKSYAIPGHRLGAIVAHPSLLTVTTTDAKTGVATSRFGSLAKSLDNMQICPPRTDTQRAVAHCVLDDAHRQWRIGVARSLRKRQGTFVESLAEPLSLARALDKLALEDGKRDEIMNLCSKSGSSDEERSPQHLGWERQSAGGYYAYVRHPFENVPSEVVARGLALLCGVVVLPGSFFMPAGVDRFEDRQIRFSIANVEADRLDTLAARLVLLTHLWRSQGAGWGS